MVIIPVDQPNIFRCGRQDFRRENGFGVIYTFVPGCGKVHIAPHHGFQAFLVQNLLHQLQMGTHKLNLRYIAIFIQIHATAHPISFVHTNVDAAGAEGSTGCPNTFPNKFISLWLVFSGKQHIVSIPIAIHGRPLQRPLQVSQRLDTGNHLNSQHICVVIHFLHFFKGIPAPKIAKIGPLRYSIGIFGIEHHQVQTAKCHMPQHTFHRIYRKYGITGTVRHQTAFFKPSCFTDGHLFFFGIAAQKSQPPEKVCFTSAGQYKFLPISYKRNSLSLLYLYQNTIYRQSNLQFRNYSFQTRPVRVWNSLKIKIQHNKILLAIRIWYLPL